MDENTHRSQKSYICVFGLYIKLFDESDINRTTFNVCDEMCGVIYVGITTYPYATIVMIVSFFEGFQLTHCRRVVFYHL